MTRRDMMTGAVALALAATPAAAAKPVKVGAPMPDVELTLVDGGKVRLADLRGDVIVLNFWATWCAPCKRELPLLDAFYRRTATHGLHVFAITTEDSVPLHQLKPVFAALSIASVRRVKGIPIDVAAVPTNYIIDRAGIVRHAASGALDLDDMNRLLVPLLREGYEPPE